MKRKQVIGLLFIGLIAGCTTPQTKTENKKLTETKKVTQPKKQEAAKKQETTKKQEPQKKGDKIVVLIETSKGNIKVELNKEKAPKTVDNFLHYVKIGHYKNTIFHRVISNFMIQGGGFDKNMVEKNAPQTVVNEAKNGLKNDTGTIAMARLSDPDSASAQFFINVKDNDALNAPSPDGWGYCVFGKVIEGMDVVNKIKGVPTGNVGPYKNVPKDPVIIKDIKVVTK